VCAAFRARTRLRTDVDPGFRCAAPWAIGWHPWRGSGAMRCVMVGGSACVEWLVGTRFGGALVDRIASGVCWTRLRGLN
jgi:hypothetical protein